MTPTRGASSQTRGTTLGLLAIVFWASTVGVSRVAIEKLGWFTTGALIYLFAGVIACAVAMARGRLRAVLDHPRRYLFVCGGLFALYTLCFYAAIGLPRQRQVTIEVALVNYLWPTTVLLFSIPLLGNRWRWFLPLGVIAALAGIFFGAMDVHGLRWSAVLQHVADNRLAFAGGLVAALSWGLYSNLSRRWGNPLLPSGVPLFMLGTGLALGIIALSRPEAHEWTPRATLALAYLCIFPTILSCTFWDVAMRTGNFVIVGSCSYLTPLLSTAISCLVLATAPGWRLWAGAMLVVAGAAACRMALREPSAG